MPGGGGGTTNTTSTVNTGPWSYQQPFLGDTFGEAKRLYFQNGPLQYYPGSTVSPFTPAQSQGYNTIAGMGTSPLIPASVTNATDTLSGKYLDPSTNPWLKATYEAAAAPVAQTFQNITAPTTDALFSANGRYGSGARYNAQNNNTFNLGQTLDTLATNIYGGNYQNERQNQVSMQGLAPSVESSRYLDPTAAVNAGEAQQAQAQKELTDQVNRFNFNQMSPWQTLGLYKGMVDGTYGQSGTMTSQTPYYSNPIGSIFGGAMGLAGTAGMLGWSPFGAAAGASGAGGVGSALGMLGMAA